ncbi:hypothetical protein C5O22_01970 [Treponema sp. J25]|nr:hypothetical protein C5O22_01970 [Treponema sp. J25]
MGKKGAQVLWSISTFTGEKKGAGSLAVSAFTEQKGDVGEYRFYGAQKGTHQKYCLLPGEKLILPTG